MTDHLASLGKTCGEHVEWLEALLHLKLIPNIMDTLDLLSVTLSFPTMASCVSNPFHFDIKGKPGKVK